MATCCVVCAAAEAGLQVTTRQRDARLAGHGEIDMAAPIRTVLEVHVDAPPAVVWRLLARIDDWPNWAPGITVARLHGALAVGTSFEWRSGGIPIKSVLSVVEPGRRLAWRGAALGLQAIHVWTLRASPTGGTVIEMAESMSGFPASLLYSSADLRAADVAWLHALAMHAK